MFLFESTVINILLHSYSDLNGFQPHLNAVSCSSASHFRQQLMTCISASPV